jgi:hypothetical protein
VLRKTLHLRGGSDSRLALVKLRSDELQDVHCSLSDELHDVHCSLSDELHDVYCSLSDELHDVHCKVMSCMTCTAH